jgi:acyl carrier protein
MDNLKKLTEAFAKGLGIDTSTIDNKLKYQSIPEWDSISHMVLISEIEEIFNISIDTDDVIDLSSFEKAKEILTKHNIKF